MRNKNYQGFSVVGLNFDSDYGQEIHACFAFNFKGFEISVSNGAICPSKGIEPVCATPILVTNLANGYEYEIPGTVEDAVEFVLSTVAGLTLLRK